MDIRNKRLIIVLGMHRSGTSAITRALQVMGVQLGDRLMPPFEGDNEKGFWEDIDINSLNIEMFNEINNDWHYLASIKQEEFEVLKQRGYLLRAVELIRRKTSNFPIYGFKDPRLLKLLPFWKEVFNYCQYDVSYILPVRHPLSVAKSLAKRNGFDIEKSYLLWLGHVINSLSGTIDCSRIVVDYDKLMQNTERELNRIAAGLHLTINAKELEIYRTEFLDNNLRHTVYELNDLLLDDAASAMVREVYTTVMDLSSAKKIDDVWLKKKTDKWEDELIRLNSSLTLADKLFKQIIAANQIVQEHHRQISILDQQLAGQEQLIVQKHEELDQKKKELTQKNEELKHKQVELDQKNEDLKHKQVELDQKNEDLKHKQVELDQKNEDLKQKKEELNQKKEELNQKNEELDQKKKELTQKNEELKHKQVELNQKNEDLKQKKEELNQKKEDLNQKKEELNQKNEELDQKNKELNQKNEELNQKNDELYQKAEELNQKKEELNQKNDELYQKKEELKQKNEELNQKNDLLYHKNQELNQIIHSRSWRITKPLRFIMKKPKRFLNKIRYLITVATSTIKRNGSLKNTIKKSLKILMKEGIRGGIIQFKKQAYNAISSIERLESKVYKEPDNRCWALSDTPGAEEKIDKNIFCSSTAILFVGQDALLAGAQVLLLSLIKWFSQHTGIEIKIILLRDGVLLDKFRIIAPTLVWEDLDHNFPDKEKRKTRLVEFVGKVDLIYGNTALAPTVYDELKYLNVPYITHVHELEKSIKTYVAANIIKKMHLYTDGYIACSTPVGLNLIHNHHIDQEKIKTIHAFIEKREIDFNNSKIELRKKLGLAEDGLLIFGCGTIYWRKGVDLFIETALILKHHGHSNVHFYWIGENIWDKDPTSHKLCSWNELEEKIENNGLLDYITFLGVKNNVFDYLLAGDLFYLPSREDPFPLVCLEAAQCSMPIICFQDAGGMPDFVGNDAGFVLPFEDVNEVVDKINFLNKNQDIITELGATARKKFLERHSLDIAAPQILNFCRITGNLHPTVSIIVPNYNCEKYLRKRLDSILNQTFKDFELILLDDSSTDRSLNVIEKYLDYPDVTLYKNQSNSGNPFIQWHKGFLQAKGEILWFAEADDFCEPDFLQKLLPVFNDASIALAYCDSLMIDESDCVIGDYSSYLDILDSQHWKSSYQVTSVQEINFGLGVKNSIPNTSAVLIRKSCVSEALFNETFQFKFSGDWFFYTQVILGKNIAFCSEKLNYHRKHSQTVSTKFNTEKPAIKLLLKEAELIHNNILGNYSINADFIKKWEFYISEQILAFYPNTSKDEFNKYYPYNLIEEKIKKAIIISKNKKRLIFLTTNDGSSNGGSEQLWRHAAIECRKRGHDIIVIIKKWDPEPDFLKELYDIGIKIFFKAHDVFNKILLFKPDLMIVSTGDQDEGIEWYESCMKYKIPYVIVNQLTKEPEYWPIRKDINEQVKKGYLGAEIVLFTGKNNLEVMERRLNCKIPNAGIFYNPFDVDRNTDIPFPPVDNGLKIAIVANLFRIHKGQHLAIELFNLKKWRDRPIHLNIYGKGNDEDVLRKQATDYNMTNVTFHGHTDNILAVWKENHAIFLPSFMEGLPLVLVGAMICGRVPVITDIGAHREVVDDNINGFIAVKPTIEALDEALERAYEKSEMWEEIGKMARKKILSIIPKDPIDDFISKIIPKANIIRKKVEVNEEFVFNSENIKIEQNKKYKVNIEIVADVETIYSAYVAVILLNKDNKETRRCLRWIKKSDKHSDKYDIVFKTKADEFNIIIGYRLNAETPLKSRISIEFPKPDPEDIVPTNENTQLIEDRWEEFIESFFLEKYVEAINKSDKKIIETDLVGVNKYISRRNVKKKWEKGIAPEKEHWKNFINNMGSSDSYGFLDPNRPLDPFLIEYLSKNQGSHFKILDVGSGPLTTLGKIWSNHKIEITAVDPLTDIYQEILKEFNVNAPVKTVYGEAEKLSQKFENNMFDLVYSSNALDHCYDPFKAIQEMLKVVKKGRYILLKNFQNEAERENYTGFHQWNLWAYNNNFLIWNRDKAFLANEIFKNEAEIKIISHKENLIIIAIKKI